MTTGYRVFELTSNCYLKGPYSPSLFPEGLASAGMCTGPSAAYASLGGSGHPAPMPGCSCGLRFAPELRDAVDHSEARRIESGRPVGTFDPIARVRASGRIEPGVIGDNGVLQRAEYLEITCVYLPMMTRREVVSKLRDFYQCPVWCGDSTVSALSDSSDPVLRWGCSGCGSHSVPKGAVTCRTCTLDFLGTARAGRGDSMYRNKGIRI